MTLQTIWYDTTPNDSHGVLNIVHKYVLRYVERGLAVHQNL